MFYAAVEFYYFVASVQSHIIRAFKNCLGTNFELFLTHYQTTNFRSSKLKEFADDDFRFDEYGRKLSRKVENTVGKGEIACYEQFLLFPQCFQKACFPEASKGVIVWEWVNPLPYDKILEWSKLKQIAGDILECI